MVTVYHSLIFYVNSPKHRRNGVMHILTVEPISSIYRSYLFRMMMETEFAMSPMAAMTQSAIPSTQKLWNSSTARSDGLKSVQRSAGAEETTEEPATAAEAEPSTTVAFMLLVAFLYFQCFSSVREGLSFTFKVSFVFICLCFFTAHLLMMSEMDKDSAYLIVS